MRHTNTIMRRPCARQRPSGSHHHGLRPLGQVLQGCREHLAAFPQVEWSGCKIQVWEHRAEVSLLKLYKGKQQINIFKCVFIMWEASWATESRAHTQKGPRVSLSREEKQGRPGGEAESREHSGLCWRWVFFFNHFWQRFKTEYPEIHTSSQVKKAFLLGVSQALMNAGSPLLKDAPITDINLSYSLFEFISSRSLLELLFWL